jgi:hypothetical protein
MRRAGIGKLDRAVLSLHHARDIAGACWHVSGGIGGQVVTAGNGVLMNLAGGTASC